MITLDTIRKPVTAELEAFDGFVDRQFTAEGELLADMLRYALSSRGKGIRPLLVMLSAEDGQMFIQRADRDAAPVFCKLTIDRLLPKLQFIYDY